MRNEAWVAAALMVVGVAAGCGESGPQAKAPPSSTSSAVAAPATPATTPSTAGPGTQPAELPKIWFPVDRQGEQALRAHQEAIRKSREEQREQVLRARMEYLERSEQKRRRPPRPRPPASAPAP
jgi:hypothetical protein